MWSNDLSGIIYRASKIYATVLSGALIWLYR